MFLVQIFDKLPICQYHGYVHLFVPCAELTWHSLSLSSLRQAAWKKKSSNTSVPTTEIRGFNQ
jgi:hypothetical protein